MNIARIPQEVTHSQGGFDRNSHPGHIHNTKRSKDDQPMNSTNTQRGSSVDLVASGQEDGKLRTLNEGENITQEEKIKRLQYDNNLLRKHVLSLQKVQRELLNHDAQSSVNKDHEAALRSQVISLQNMIECERRRRVAREGELRNEIERLRLVLDERLAGIHSVTSHVGISSPLILPHGQCPSFSPESSEHFTDSAFDNPMDKPLETRSIRSTLSSLRSLRAQSDRADYNRTDGFDFPQRVAIDEESDEDNASISDKVFQAEKDTEAGECTPSDTGNLQRRSNDSVEQCNQVTAGNSSKTNLFLLPKSDFSDAYKVMCWTASRRDERRKRLTQITGTKRRCGFYEQNGISSPCTLSLIVSSVTSAADEREAEDSVSCHPILQDKNASCGMPPSSQGASPLLSAVKPQLLPQNSTDQDTKALIQQNNPNQIGVEILKEKNRTWYTKQVLCTALLAAIPPEREVPCHMDVNAPTVEDTIGCFNSHPKEAAGRLDGVEQSHLASYNNKMPLDGVFESIASDFLRRSCSLSGSSFSSEESDTIRCMLEPTKTGAVGQGKKTSPRITPSEGTSATAPAVLPDKPLLYKDVNPQALQRAIEETLPFHFHCASNVPVMTPGLQPPKDNKPLRAFAQDNNTDPNLLLAFSPFHRSSASPKFSDEADPCTPDTGKYRDDEVCILYHAPVIFNQIRSFLGLNTDILRAALKDATWRQSMSPGKSGTMFFFFGDFVMKTIRKSEFAFLCQRFLPGYVQYCERNPHTLLPRFFALMSMKWLKLGTTRRIILMQNVFTTRYYIHRIYDVKGSTVGRNALQSGKEPARTAYGALLLKDNDLPPQLIKCGPYQRAILTAQLRSDVSFLKSLNIVDYSCMIGVRGRLFPKVEGPSKTILMGGNNPTTWALNPSLMGRAGAEGWPVGGDPAGHGNRTSESSGPSSFVENQGKLENGTEVERLKNNLCVCFRGCDGGLLSLPIHTSDDDTMLREEVYYIGLIDVLQEYNSAKKLENFAKGFVNDRAQLSVVPPKEYAERLCRVIERITV